jgi:hypothetical protein
LPAQAWVTLAVGLIAVIGVVLTVRRRTRVAITLSEYNNKPVPQWLRDVAAGRDASPTEDT